jgi:DHA1 family bicyclomycin/chloramphenicol resistance-like MFS transporter
VSHHGTVPDFRMVKRRIFGQPAGMHGTATSRGFLTFVLGTLTAFGPLSIDMYLPSLPAMGGSLHASAVSVRLTLASFMLGMGVGQLIYGPLSDRYGRRMPLLAGIALYVAASFGCALAANIELLIALRFLQAVGGAAGPVIARAVVRDLYSGPDIARTLSVMTLVMGAAPILAPLLGGAVLAWFGWRAIFGVLAGLGVVAAALTFLYVPNQLQLQPPAALVSNLKRLALDRRFTTSVLAAGLSQATLFTYISSAPFVYMTLLQVNPRTFSLLFGMNALGFIGATQVNRLLLRRFSIAGIAHAAALVLCLAQGWLYLVVYLPMPGIERFALAVFLCATVLGLLAPNVTALALESHASIAGLASSLLGAAQFGAGALAASLVGDHADSARPMVNVMAACALSALIVTWFLRRDVGGEHRGARWRYGWRS